MKALFVGLGSIGQRHLRNFKKLAGSEYTVLAYRTTNSNNIIKDGQALPCKSLADYYDFHEYNSLDNALAQKPNVGFICNPSNLHLETTLLLAERGTHLFIEKPLATDNALLAKLEGIIRQKKLISMVGFQSRFHPCIQETKRILGENEFGKVVSAQFNWSTYLPDHHPYEDYRQSYAARTDLGGGVTFCLSHELDLIQFFFGQPDSVYAVEGGTSKLDMKAEDTVAALFRCGDKTNSFPVSLRLSFAQGLNSRRFEILMEEGFLECDLQNNWLTVTNHMKKKIYERECKGLKRNDLFLEEMKHFLDSVSQHRETNIPVSEGTISLFIALAIHESLRTGTIMNVLL